MKPCKNCQKRNFKCGSKIRAKDYKKLIEKQLEYTPSPNDRPVADLPLLANYHCDAADQIPDDKTLRPSIEAPSPVNFGYAIPFQPPAQDYPIVCSWDAIYMRRYIDHSCPFGVTYGQSACHSSAGCIIRHFGINILSKL